MAGQRPQVEREEHPVFEHVVGGELPLSPDEARRWLDEPGGGEDTGPIQGVCRLFGGAPENAVWLRFGRSALGIALDLAGVGAETKIAMASYQCPAFLSKRCASLLFYQLRADLAPDEEGILDAAGRAGAVVTCAYFGSAALDDRLAALGRRLRSLANEPWIIEDRAMAFPAPVSAADAAARCDFLMYSLRKSYPVPDGAPLVACSERAREALSTWRASAPGPAPGEPEGPLRVKVLAKVKRHAWVTSRPLVDDPGLNGLRESVASESLINSGWAMDADNRADARPGSQASAAYILARDLAEDGRTVRDRSRAVVEALHHTLSGTFPLQDCTGVAVPVLLDGRRDFLANGRAQGIFLPVHWPRYETVPLGADVRRWYEAEIGLPTLPASPPEDVDYLIRRLATLYTKGR